MKKVISMHIINAQKSQLIPSLGKKILKVVKKQARSSEQDFFFRPELNKTDIFLVSFPRSGNSITHKGESCDSVIPFPINFSAK